MTSSFLTIPAFWTNGIPTGPAIPGAEDTLLSTRCLGHWTMEEESASEYTIRQNTIVNLQQLLPSGGLAQVNSSTDHKLGSRSAGPFSTIAYLSLAEFTFLLPAYSFTTWVKRANTAADGTIFSKGGFEGFDLGFTSAGLVRLRVTNEEEEATTTLLDSGNDIEDTDWHFIAAVIDTANHEIKLSVDGNTFVTAEFEGTINQFDWDLCVGALESGTEGNINDWLTGLIDSFSIFEGPLSQTDVTKLYNGGTGASYPFDTEASNNPATNISAYWDLDETSGNNVDHVDSLILSPAEGPLFESTLRGNGFRKTPSGGTLNHSITEGSPLDFKDDHFSISFTIKFNDLSGTDSGDYPLFTGWGPDGKAIAVYFRPETPSNGFISVDFYDGNGSIRTMYTRHNFFQEDIIYLFIITYDKDRDEYLLSVNGDTYLYARHCPEGIKPTLSYPTTFKLGESRDGVSVATKCDYTVDDLTFWSKALNTAARKEIWNNGYVNFYPFVENLTEDIIAAWKFNEASPSATRVDSENSFNLSYLDSPIPVGTGISGNCLKQNTDNFLYHEYSEDSLLDIKNTSFTIAVWYKTPSKPAGESHPLVRSSDSGGISWHVSYGTEIGQNNNITLAIKNPSSTVIYCYISSDLITIGQWHLLVARYDSVQDKMYLTLDNSTTVEGTLSGGVAPTPSYPGTFYISKVTDVASEYYLDEMTIWNKFLNNSSLTELWNNGNGLFYPFTS